MFHTVLLILLLFSSSFGDKGDDAKQRQNIVQNAAGKNPPQLEETPSKMEENPPKMEDKKTSVSGGSEVEAGAAVGDRGGVVEVGESQGAGDRFRREEREEPDQNEAGEQGEGGGKHRRFKLRPTKLGARFIDRGSEEGENK